MGALKRLQATCDAEASRHESAGGSIRALELEWGEAGWAASSGVAAAAGAGGFDFVVMSELVFDENSHEALLWTLEKALSPQVSSHPGGNPGANLKSIYHRYHPILVDFVWELTNEAINLPPGWLQGGPPPFLGGPWCFENSHHRRTLGFFPSTIALHF